MTTTTPTTTTTTTTTPTASVPTTTTTAYTATGLLTVVKLDGPDKVKVNTLTYFTATYFGTCKKRRWAWSCSSPRGELANVYADRPSDSQIGIWIGPQTQCEKGRIFHFCENQLGLENLGGVLNFEIVE
eukprot:Gregarina_sp_Pseudo_9__586@NODE_1376_length_1651_cov_262_851117_g304_i1_p3_GENE_NODE_1376_length_1651_cov_262_851117_g304_i1NODE_1376_length_1651_cov_262_851117_g304_i1_p3_ORF_typecomplete_len129_score1_71_NODE_1376_length_1651_cov_262_851117_g304_i110311417